jgi:hypothetical protein
MVRLYARSLKGSRARGQKPNKRGKNVSIIGAIYSLFQKGEVRILTWKASLTIHGFCIPHLFENRYKSMKS